VIEFPPATYHKQNDGFCKQLLVFVHVAELCLSANPSSHDMVTLEATLLLRVNFIVHLPAQDFMELNVLLSALQRKYILLQGGEGRINMYALQIAY